MPGRRIATVLMLDVVGSTHIAAAAGRRSVPRALLPLQPARPGRRSSASGGRRKTTPATASSPPSPSRTGRSDARPRSPRRSGASGIEIRSGIHTGQTEDQAGKTHGIAVVIGARVMSLADAGDILVTSTTKELVTGSGFGFEDFSAHELKGVPGTWQVFAVTAWTTSRGRGRSRRRKRRSVARRSSRPRGGSGRAAPR